MAESERLVRRHMPCASLARLRELGLDPGRYASCAEPHGRGVHGCPYWHDCRFDRKDWGGFKGDRPHNVAYFLRTHEGRKKTDFIACYGFVAALQARMIAGMAAEMKGERHEFIRIIGQEGSEIPIKYVHEAPLPPGAPYNTPREIIAEMQKIRVPEYPDPTSVDKTMEYELELEKLMAAMPEMSDMVVGVDLEQAVAQPPKAEEVAEPAKEKGRGR